MKTSEVKETKKVKVTPSQQKKLEEATILLKRCEKLMAEANKILTHVYKDVGEVLLKIEYN